MAASTARKPGDFFKKATMTINPYSLAARAFCAALVAALTACGGGGSASTTNTVPIVANATPALSAQAAAFLNIDLANLASYAPVFPAHYDGTVAGLDNTPAGTTPTNAVATLGRVLFYDKRLS